MGCASVGSEYAASPVDAQGRVTSARSTDSGLVISGVELRHYASNYFGLVEITFENATPEWVHMSQLSLDFGDAARNEAVLVPSGADLESWYLSTLQRKPTFALRITGRRSTLSSLSVRSWLSRWRHHWEARKSRPWAARLRPARRRQRWSIVRIGACRARRACPWCRRAIFSPFLLPCRRGCSGRKWILLQTRSLTSPCISSLFIDYDVQEGGHERVLVKFRSDVDRSEWQRLVCRRSPRLTPAGRHG